MATTEELQTVLRETLESRGVMGQLKAQIRAEVYKALDDQTEEKPQLSDENLMINELIREYLQFNGYNYTRSVFQTETGQPREGLPREFIAQELSLHQGEDSVPLLYQMLTHCKGRALLAKPHPPENTSLNSAPSSHHHGNHTTSNEGNLERDPHPEPHLPSSPPTVVIQGHIK